jgi:hypothetical protein
MKEVSSPIRRRFEEYFRFWKLKEQGNADGDWNSEAILKPFLRRVFEAILVIDFVQSVS